MFPFRLSPHLLGRSRSRGGNGDREGLYEGVCVTFSSFWLLQLILPYSFLLKQTNTTSRGWQRCYAAIYQDPDAETGTILTKLSMFRNETLDFNCAHVTFELPKCAVTPYPSTMYNRENTFGIRPDGSEKLYVMCASTESERNTWISVIQQTASEKFTGKLVNLGSALTSAALSSSTTTGATTSTEVANEVWVLVFDVSLNRMRALSLCVL